MNENTINIIGAGLAGSEAALQFAARGWKVNLFEMRPAVTTEAHETGYCAELVCSNSLKSTRLDTGAGLLKAEINRLGCKLLHLAEECSVAAGHALAVDRLLFAQRVTEVIQQQPQINYITEEVSVLPAGKTIIATGPLSSDAIMETIRTLIGANHLYFFDAIAPIVSTDSIDFSKIYSKDRYDKGEPDYLNSPFEKTDYLEFVEALSSGEKHEAHEFEDKFFEKVDFSFYENCIPVEEIARRGVDTLRHGVMRPMGLEDPKTGRKPYGVMQLRSENADRTAYNIVGCQTMLRYPEQKRIFRMIPGLENAEFLRYGSIHRNSFLDAPKVFNQDFSLKDHPEISVAGQLSGVEGYVESIASGLMVAMIICGEIDLLPAETISGQLQRRLLDTETKRMQPVNANFGLLPDLPITIRDKKKKREALAERSLESLESYLQVRSE